MKYLYLNDLPDLFNKSWSFCQKEVASTRLKAEKKYHMWKQRYLITEEDLQTYIKENQHRVGNIEDFKVTELSFWLDELRSEKKDKKEQQQVRYKTSTPNNNKQQYQTQPVEEDYNDNNEEKEVRRVNKKTSSRNSSNSSPSSDNYDNTLNVILTKLEELSKSWASDDNQLYLKELKTQIDELKKEKDKNEEENKKLNDELREESRRVEKVYFISDRYEKVVNKQNELIFNLISLSKQLWEWEKIRLWDIKMLLASMPLNEQVQIDEKTREVKMINQPNTSILKEINDIKDDVILERSREDEFKKVEEKLKKNEEEVKEMEGEVKLKDEELKKKSVELKKNKRRNLALGIGFIIVCLILMGFVIWVFLWSGWGYKG